MQRYLRFRLKNWLNNLNLRTIECRGGPWSSRNCGASETAAPYNFKPMFVGIRREWIYPFRNSGADESAPYNFKLTFDDICRARRFPTCRFGWSQAPNPTIKLTFVGIRRQQKRAQRLFIKQKKRVLLMQRTPYRCPFCY